MKTIVRWMIVLLFCAAVALFVLIIALPILVNPNDYKAQLSHFVREQTGRELVIGGDIKLQVSSLLHVSCVVGSARLATLTSDAEFPDSTILESEKTTIEISLLPLLLSRRLHLTRMECDGVALNLLHNKDGRGNWQRLSSEPVVGVEKSESPAKAGEAPNTDEASLVPVPIKEQKISAFLASAITWFRPKISGLDMGKLHLINIKARYENRESGRVVLLKTLQIKTGRLREKVPFPFEASFNLALDNSMAPDTPALIHSGEITMQGNATAFFQEQRIVLEDLQVEGLIKGKSLSKKRLKVSLASNSEILLPQPDQGAAAMGAITIKYFTLTHGDIALQGSGTIDNFSSPRFELALSIPECSPQATLQHLKATRKLATNTNNTEAFTRMQAKLLLKGDMEMAEISDLTVLMDESTLTGSLRHRFVPDMESPQWEADLKVDRLDSDWYSSPPSSPLSAAISSAGANPSWSPFLFMPKDFILSTGFLKTVSLKLNLAVDSLKVRGASLSQVQATVTGKDGVIQLAPLTATLYGGSLKCEDSIDLTGKSSKIQIKRTLTTIQLAPLSKDMTGKDSMTGTATIHADLTSSGLSQQKILNQMNGAVRLEILNGEIKAVQMLPIIRLELAGQRKETGAAPENGEAAGQGPEKTTSGENDEIPEKAVADVSEDESAEAMPFTRLTATGVIKDGVLHTDDLAATTASSSITGTANLDLASQQVDSSLTISFPPDCDQDGSRGVAELCNKAISYKIVGSFAHLSQTANLNPSATVETPTQVAEKPVEQSQATEQVEQVEALAAPEQEQQEEKQEEKQEIMGD